MDLNSTKPKPDGGSLAALLGPLEEPSAPPSLPVSAWIKIAVLALLFLAVNYWQVLDLLGKWQEPNWTHGFLIPLFSLYLLYVNRQRVLAAPRKACLWGLALLVFSILLTLYCLIVLGNFWLCQLSMVLSLLALVLYVGGWRLLAATWVPIAFLALAMPIPERIYTQIALPLQNLAARCSGAILAAFGVHVDVTQSHLDILSVTGHPHALNIVEACSGVRSLMAFVALSVAFAFVEERPNWQRAVLVLSGVPIAVACNILRVTLTACMFVWDRPEFGEKLMHELMGLALLIPAFLLLLPLSKLLQNLYVEVDDDPEPAEQPGPGGSP